MSNVLLRLLSEDDHDDDHGNEPGEDKKLQNVKIIVIFLMLFASSFVFLPYLPQL